MRSKEIEVELKRLLSPERYKHSLGVAEAAAKLAKVYSVDVEKAYLAGLIHDCAKELSRPYQLILAMRAKSGFDITQIPFPFLYHGPAGRVFAETHFAIGDEDVLRAVSLHILGDVNMSQLEKIIFVADYIEINRTFSWRETIWKVAFQDLDRGVLLGCETTIEHLLSNGKAVHEKMKRTKDYYDKRNKEEIHC